MAKECKYFLWFMWEILKSHLISVATMIPAPMLNEASEGTSQWCSHDIWYELDIWYVYNDIYFACCLIHRL